MDARAGSAYDAVRVLRGTVRSLAMDLEGLCLYGDGAVALGLSGVQLRGGGSSTSPEACVQLFDAIERAAQQFHTTLTTIQTSAENAQAAQRAVALVRELSSQSTELEAAASVLEHRASPRSGYLPAPLWTCALADAAAGPISAFSDARRALYALCDALKDAAGALHLECFLERAEESAEDANMHEAGAVCRTHTFTSGGKIFVLDIELGVVSSSDVLRPHVSLRISYAHDDASHSSQSGASTTDARYATMLAWYLQQLASLLFGVEPERRESDPLWPFSAARAPTPYTHAIRLWDYIQDNLSVLAQVDELSAHTAASVERPQPTRRIDLFARLDTITSAAEAFCVAEMQAIAGDTTRDARVLPYVPRRGMHSPQILSRPRAHRRAPATRRPRPRAVLHDKRVCSSGVSRACGGATCGRWRRGRRRVAAARRVRYSRNGPHNPDSVRARQYPHGDRRRGGVSPRERRRAARATCRCTRGPAQRAGKFARRRRHRRACAATRLLLR